MFAVVESGSIISYPKGNKGVKIGDYNYPPAVFTLWSESERNAVGIYTVEIDETNRKDETFYINTDILYRKISKSARLIRNATDIWDANRILLANKYRTELDFEIKKHLTSLDDKE